MAGLGIGIAWFGYWVMYYGLTQIQGGQWGFLDLGIPSRWTADKAATPRDGGGAGASKAPVQTPNPGQDFQPGKPGVLTPNTPTAPGASAGGPFGVSPGSAGGGIR